VLHCVGRRFSDELINRPKEFYRVANKIEKPKNGGQACAWVVKVTDDDENA
jgi:hypothetical protein